MNWLNPYSNHARFWLRGNLHTHSGEGLTQQEIFDAYEGLGYDFICLSDHMKVNRTRPPRHSRLMLLPGLEWNSPTGDHMNLIGFDRSLLEHCATEHDPERVLRIAARPSVLKILNHPNWQEPPHYSRETLASRIGRAHGIEIYNGLIDVLAGTALATEKWDYLLSQGHPTLGFASDDAHQAPHIGQAWIMVNVIRRTARDVFRAILQGRFYASTGVCFRRIRRAGRRIEIEAENADEIWAVGEWGRRLIRQEGARLVFDFSEHPTSYVRFTAFGRGARMGWTQPFYRMSPEGSGTTTSPS
jgi:hypothetical protein